MKDDYWFKHDANARHDPKIKKIRREKGVAAKAIYWDLVEMLRCSPDGRLPINSTIDEVTDDNHLDTTDIPRYIINDSGLFESDATHFWSNRLLAEIQYAKERAERNKVNGQRGGRPRKETEQKPVQNPEQTQQKPSGFDVANPEKTTDNSIQITDNSTIIPSSKDSGINNIYPGNEEIFSEDEVEKVAKSMTPEEMVAIWNAGCGELPKARPLTEKRKQSARVRIKEFGKTKLEQVDAMKEITARLAKSDFANGNNNRRWRADFGWLINSPEHWVNVLEGRYDNRTSTQQILGNKNVNDLWKD